jgi:carboxyl-terminal processing protease
VRKARPTFKSTGGRLVMGGGGVVPDVIVKPDTITTPEQELLRAVGPKFGVVYTTVYGYTRELKGSVRPDFVVTPQMRNELYNRLAKAEVKVERKTFDAAEPLVNRWIETRLASMAFGDSTVFRRTMDDDRQLLTALDYLKKGRSQRELLALAAREPTVKQ